MKFTSFEDSRKDLDPVVIILVHRVMALRREAAKSEGVKDKAEKSGGSTRFGAKSEWNFKNRATSTEKPHTPSKGAGSIG